jgi:hypothetical protein
MLCDMKIPKNWTTEMAISILEMHDSGKRLREICERYNLHHSSVQKFLVQNGRTPHPRAFLTGSARVQAIDLCKTMSARQVAKRLGLSDSTVRKALHESGEQGWSPELNAQEKERACELYRSGLPYPRIADLIQRDAESIRIVLHKLGVEFRPKRKLDSRAQRDILNQYETGITPARLGETYNVHENTIKKAVVDRGGKLRGHRDDVHRTIPLDADAFEHDSEDAEYWTGFAMADGTVNDNGVFAVGLQIGDIAHLYKLRRFLKSGARVAKGTVNRGGYKPGAEFAKLSVWSMKLVDSLKEAGVVPRKTGSEKLLKYQLSRHTWRGAIDGDGSLGWHKRGYFWIKMYGSKTLCEQFRQFVLTLVPDCRAEVQRSGPIFGFGLCCGPAEVVARELYRDCSAYLNRKYRIVCPLLRAQRRQR